VGTSRPHKTISMKTIHVSNTEKSDLSRTDLFKGIDKAYKYAVVYTEVVVAGSYWEICRQYGSDVIVWKRSNGKKLYDKANFFKSLDEAKKDMSILNSITNKKYINVHIVKR
jgi:hypothetical protein